MAFLPFRPKFLRALVNRPPTSGDNAQKQLPAAMKVLYEFWGFCVNGGDSLTVPGGFSTSHVTGSYIEMPAGFESGSTVLLASGTDGYTQQGLPYFSTHTPIFTTASIGKHIVAWKSGSTSTDDSIYEIKELRSAFSVVVDPTSGGTPMSPSGSIPILTARTDINYRIINFDAPKAFTYTQGQHFILQFNGASDVNPGQRNSQAKLVLRNSVFGNIRTFHIHLSPSGSWNGTTFVSESIAEIGGEGTLDLITGGPEEWVSATGVNQLVSVFADKTGIIFHLAWDVPQATAGTWVIEIPQRLYPADRDPNVICARNSGRFAVNHGINGFGDGHRFFPSPHDSTLRRWPILVRGIMDGYWPFNYSNGHITTLRVQQFNHFYNPIVSKFLSSAGLLSLGSVASEPSAVGQYCLARARIRTVRYCSNGVPLLQRIGDNEDRWVCAGFGILYPWDHAIMPDNRMFR